MFPSCGYFSSFPCPFFVNGLCERPYCHFRHSKHDIEKAKEDAPSYSSTDGISYSTTTTSGPASPSSTPVDCTPTLAALKPVADTIDSDDVYFTSASAEKDLPPPPSLSQEQETSSFSIPSFTDNSKYQVPIAEEPEQYHTASPEKTQEQNGSNSRYALLGSGPPSLPTYLPTPKTPLLPAPQPVSVTDNVGLPLYQPTPKRELKRRHVDQAKKKRKGTDLEYDPEKNFSCAGLTNSSHEPQEENEDDLDYQPTKKKARGPGPVNKNRKARLSCESLMGKSPDNVGESDDEEMPDGQFSDEEADKEQTVKKTEADDEEEGEDEEEESEDFEDIDDDDISSDDEFVEVPDAESGARKSKAKKSAGSKTFKTSSAKSSKSASNTKTKSVKSDKAGSSKSTKQEQRRISSDGSSKPSKLKSQVNESSKVAAEKSGKSSSHKRTSSSSSSGKVVPVKKDSKKSSSTSSSSRKIHSSGKIHSSDKTHQPSKHSSKESGSQSSAKHLPKEKGSLSPQSEGAKIKHRSGSSSSKSASAEKHTSSKISTKQDTFSRSSLSSSSSSLKHSSSKTDAERRSSSERKAPAIKHSSSSSGEKQTNSVSKDPSGQKIVLAKHSSSASKTSSGKHSGRGAKDSKPSSANKHSNSDRKTSSSNRHSSIDSKSGEHRSHSKSSESIRKESSAKALSKERSSSGAKNQGSEKTWKKHSSSEQKLHRKNSASSTNSGHGKKEKADSSSHHKGDKSSSQKSDSNTKNGKKLLERMNSNLFGESDSDNEEVSFAEPSSDEVAETGLEEPPMEEGAVEEQEVDYSQFIHDSDFEDEDTFDECLRIFKETTPQKKMLDQTEKKLTKDLKAEPSASDATGKKRTAHKAAVQTRKSGLAKKERPRSILSPTEVMHNRIMEMQRRALERAAREAVQEQVVSSTSGLSAASKVQGLNQAGDKQRVAHTPKPSAFKQRASAANPEGKVTLAITASKTEKRVAHTPNLTNIKRPVIPASFGSKVPSNIRQRYLNLIIDECLKFCANEEEAYKKGLQEETGVYDRASNKNIYLRVAVNTITRLRAEAKESLPGSSSSKQRRSSLTQSHEATLGGSRALKTSFTLHRSTGAGKKVEVPMTAAELYQKLLKYAMTEEQLKDNGYPFPDPETPGKVVILGKRYRETDKLLKSNERTCTRCGKRFIVNSDGSYAFSEECVYHWTRAYPRKKSGFIQHIYNCCNSDTSTKGCQVASNHVHEQNKIDEMSGFMRTMPHSPTRDGNYGIYALDCEMVYTQGGLELARVTVVDVEGETVYESLVQPFHPVVDFNTRFSGISAADLKGVETTRTDVQAILLNRFSDETILMGHSLESDLFALKLMHMTVVDTSVVFPHRLGPPYKRALKSLMLETFQKIIQCDDGGHDSKEDAVACLQLMKWRIKEDSKREQRYS
ncbi:RNA exonuclease 1 homolog [Littorina saxatilis]|uniref:RNA exonuclease 1 homolog n=1 Tax=Littorina saxatilis TaxID=31220 RepID=UPI0038B67BDF